MELSQADKLGMTPEEIEALTGVGAEDALKQMGGEQTPEPTEAAAAEPPAPEPTAEPVATPAEATAETPEPAAAPAKEPPAERPYVPQFNPGDMTQVEAKLKELLTAKNEAFKKLMDGAISPEEYATTETELLTQREQLTIAKTLAEANAQSVAQYQTRELQKLADTAKKAGEVDYANPKVAARFDAEMNLLAADKDWAGKDFSELLAEAHKNVVSLMGVKKPAAPAPAAAAPVAAPAVGPRTLGGLPSAAPANTGGDPVMDKFASLKGDEAEMYLASLPKGEVERLMRSTVH